MAESAHTNEATVTAKPDLHLVTDDAGVTSSATQGEPMGVVVPAPENPAKNAGPTPFSDTGYPKSVVDAPIKKPDIKPVGPEVTPPAKAQVGQRSPLDAIPSPAAVTPDTRPEAEIVAAKSALDKHIEEINTASPNYRDYQAGGTTPANTENTSKDQATTTPSAPTEAMPASTPNQVGTVPTEAVPTGATTPPVEAKPQKSFLQKLQFWKK